ncbi:MAG: lytic transglycosylase domain-containing protein [Gammaproteobacteria bacterium]|nr:MAG: lytic transglycosylase domain-containing protein [Gammaproteobacteria bacterium]
MITAWLSLGLAGPSLADVFKYRDAQGHIYLTDKPMKGGYRLLKRYRFKTTRPRAGGASLAALRQRKARYAPLIDAAAREAGVQPALVHAVVRAESAYRADAVSSKGARGLMQLMPATARRFDVTHPNDPRQNLRGGTRYLSDLLDLFGGDLRLALAAYNAGENAVISYGNRIPPYPETREYVRKVLRFYRQAQVGDQLAQR